MGRHMKRQRFFLIVDVVGDAKHIPTQEELATTMSAILHHANKPQDHYDFKASDVVVYKDLSDLVADHPIKCEGCDGSGIRPDATAHAGRPR